MPEGKITEKIRDLLIPEEISIMTDEFCRATDIYKALGLASGEQQVFRGQFIASLYQAMPGRILSSYVNSVLEKRVADLCDIEIAQLGLNSPRISFIRASAMSLAYEYFEALNCANENSKAVDWAGIPEINNRALDKIFLRIEVDSNTIKDLQ
ncbi:hypothetical protein JW796_03860 [Candidatus Dojkabacteria bacterium]|nr:hypothetical protein [Candidatus Dojkabacteria bacterium]